MWLQILISMSLFFSFIPPIIYGAGKAELMPMETADTMGKKQVIPPYIVIKPVDR